MNTRFLLIIVFLAGLSSGWVGKTYLAPVQSKLIAVVTGGNRVATIPADVTHTDTFTNSTGALNSTAAVSNSGLSTTQSISNTSLVRAEPASTGTTVFVLFKKMLNDRLYYDAMNLYQEQFQQDEQTATELKRIFLDQLNVLSANKKSNDFSELIESYLSLYYDDINVLFLLADFNQANASYLEVVDVYLLAKTYAYTTADQQNVVARFNNFIKEVDSIYTNQKNWLALINLYSYIDTSGLMTSPYQYRQALAHLRSGDEYFATEQFRLLLNDSLVGESAAIALNRLAENSEAPVAADNTALESSETIPLEKHGNQFLVNLTINRQDEIKLLIDTGASITTLSRSSFDSLITSADAVERDRRVFRTASGVVMGTVYSVSELAIGPYTMRDTQIAVLDFDVNRNIDGLLGMNVLGQFRFQIDQQNTRLHLSR